MRKPVIGITIGDPSGAGPEICLKALNIEELLQDNRIILFGDKHVINRVMPIVKFNKEINVINSIDEYEDGKVNLVSIDNMLDNYEFGKVQARCGEAGFKFIKEAIEWAIEDKVDAVVTGPINKEALNNAGIHYSGHTEIFADLTESKDYAMLLTGGPIRVIHVSTHVSLRKACDRVKKDRVYKVIKLAYSAMKDLGIESPRIGVLGLNPHSGENGLFGDEEINEIIPAINNAKSEGLNVTGPIPPDTAFLHCRDGKYDVMVAMYHDQGHIPLKIVDFMGGVNVTVGLPIIRTSVDHGTVFGKAGKGTADETSMIKAIEMAIQFAKNRSK
jgi:4-phospho-D-threonate 3-dehydrogenase / 4-phospho-D-erythronate 3-dehydrogenase